MKTKDFIRCVKKLGLEVGTWQDEGDIYVKGEYSEVYALVNENYVFSVDTSWSDFFVLENNIKYKLFKLLVEYASTPIEDRKEEKKYYFYLNHISNCAENFLNYNVENEDWIISDNTETHNYKMKFTLTELPDWAKEMLEQGHLVKEEVE